jgi:endoglucanase
VTGLESGMDSMKYVRRLGIANHAGALLILPALVACSSDDKNASRPDSNTMSTEAPAGDNGGGDNDGVNPQRNPEQWQPPGLAATDPLDFGQVPAPSDPDPPGEDAGTTPTEPSTPEPPASNLVTYRGINLAGAEFGSALPGTVGRDYAFPTHAEVDYYMGKRMNTFRVGFKWERLQRSANAELDADYASRLDDVVTYATSKGANVILNPHNFARYYEKTVGSSDVPSSVFADLWRRLATKYKNNAKVFFNLVNEPHDISSEQWVGAANAAIAAARNAGASNLIIVPGNGWTGAHSWTSTYYGTPNSKAMLQISDSANNILFEVHQYMDSDSSGSSGDCVSQTVGRERLQAFVKWLRDNNKKGFLGEFAGGNNTTCSVAVKNMLDYVTANKDVVLGWTWWAGGPMWGEYKFTLDPKNGNDRPQMAWLTPFLQE